MHFHPQPHISSPNHIFQPPAMHLNPSAMHFKPQQCIFTLIHTPATYFDPHLCVSTSQPCLLSPPMTSFDPQPCVSTAHPPILTTLAFPALKCTYKQLYMHFFFYFYFYLVLYHPNVFPMFILFYFSLFYLKRVYEQSNTHFLYLCIFTMVFR
jgi:hypothetical protein